MKQIRFTLERAVDVGGVSGSGRVAEGVRFANGKCALSWLTAHTSISVYDDIETVLSIHGHQGKTRVVFLDFAFGGNNEGSPFLRAHSDCVQDSCENVPFASVGGLDARAVLKAPDYITEADAAEYLRGYAFAARQAYGDDWRTCSFGWSAAGTIGGAQ